MSERKGGKRPVYSKFFRTQPDHGLCKIGDTIETTLSTGNVLSFRCVTQDLVDYANCLIIRGKWRKVKTEKESGK